MTAYCSIVIRPARMYEDPEPAEMCENEVEVEGDVCNRHDGCDGCTSRYCEDCNG